MLPGLGSPNWVAFIRRLLAKLAVAGFLFVTYTLASHPGLTEPRCLGRAARRFPSQLAYDRVLTRSWRLQVLPHNLASSRRPHLTTVDTVRRVPSWLKQK